MSYEFTVIVPVFNEEDCLPQLFTQLEDYLPKASKKTRVLFVDDGSSDASAKLIRDFCANRQDYRYLFFEQNFGKGAALKAAFDHTVTPLLGYLDADLQTYPQDFEKLLPFIDDHELVTGWRRD